MRDGFGHLYFWLGWILIDKSHVIEDMEKLFGVEHLADGKMFESPFKLFEKTIEHIIDRIGGAD